MLNELSEVVNSLDRLGIATASRHPRINPMGKNRDLLVISLNGEGKPTSVEVLSGDIAANLFRIEHGSAGSSFPGFNIPTPLRRLDEVPLAELEVLVGKLLAIGKNKNSTVAELEEAIRELFKLSKSQSFTASQVKQFQRSCAEVVEELDETLSSDLSELTNFTTLLDVVLKAKPSLSSFADSLAELFVSQKRGGPRFPTRNSLG